jgi:hypothetical protein
MKYLFFLFLYGTFILMNSCNQEPGNMCWDGPGEIFLIEDFKSEHVQSRNIHVWVPDGYDSKKAPGYPVIYMHDGQNLFFPELAYTGITWEVATTLTCLINKQAVEPVIVVGIWNTPLRFQEYMPQDESIGYPEEMKAELKKQNITLLSDNYTDFIVQELKPFIDKNYNTRTDRESTFTIGSSMGGLISLYALTRYPDVFGGAGCVSTHWPVGHDTDSQDMMSDLLVKYFAVRIPAAETHKIYFDYGTHTLDSLYEKHQAKMDNAMMELGYENGSALWRTIRFDGADHSEDSWRKRFDIIAKFLLSKQD